MQQRARLSLISDLEKPLDKVFRSPWIDRIFRKTEFAHVSGTVPIMRFEEPTEEGRIGETMVIGNCADQSEVRSVSQGGMAGHQSALANEFCNPT